MKRIISDSTEKLLPKFFEKTTLFFDSFDSGRSYTYDAPSPCDLRLSVCDGPDKSFVGYEHTGISGDGVLKISGHPEKEPMRFEVVIADGQNITVSENSTLEYYIFPSRAGENYDYNYSQSFFSVDLYLSDGSRLSDKGICDGNGVHADPSSMGKSKRLYVCQWNKISVPLGALAGRTITRTVISYDGPPKSSDFVSFFDDISIYDLKPTERTRLCHYINILRGTNDSSSFSRGLTAPAVLLPHGFNMYGPITNHASDKHYDYLSRRFDSIGISHEPSIWIGDRGTWQFMINTSRLAGDGKSFSTADMTNIFAHENELAFAHYYSVAFDEKGGDAADSMIELSPTDHGLIVRLSFGKSAAHHSVIFDCQNGPGGIAFDDDGSFTAFSDHKNNRSKTVYIYGTFSEKPISTAVCGKNAIASFSADEIYMTFATSYISYGQAKKNHDPELRGRTFESICADAADRWDDKLSCIDNIKGAAERDLENIYSGLYCLFKYPNSTAENIGTDKAPAYVYRSPYTDRVEEGEMMINNGFWDTYRTCWPAYSLLSPQDMPRLLNGFLKHYDDNGLIPRWSAPGGVNCMVGTSSDLIFADAAVKDFSFDIEKAYAAAYKNACVYSPNPTDGGRELLEKSIFLGWTPGSREGFSWSMEGYINDFGISVLAGLLLEHETDPERKSALAAERRYFENRAKNYRLLFVDGGDDIGNKWFRGREADGSLTSDNNYCGKFDPCFWGKDFTETDAYNMSASVPFDGAGLAALYGGRAELAKKLDSIFETKAYYRGYGACGEWDGIHEQREAREVKMGRYGHSNQPSHHLIYMYNFTDRPWKAQKYAREVLSRLYIGGDFGQGYPGDEDNGEMSAWFILSALGFYPLCLATGQYAIGSPLFDEVDLNIGGKKLHIVAENNSPENIYVRSVTINGKPSDRLFITHDELASGGELRFVMGSTPSDFGKIMPFSLSEYGKDRQPAVDLTENAKITSDIPFADRLFDNCSLTETVIHDGDRITIDFASGVSIEMITLTSSEHVKDVGRISLKAYKNGSETENTVTLNGVSFDWGRETRPFEAKLAADRVVIEFSGETVLSQIELLGHV